MGVRSSKEADQVETVKLELSKSGAEDAHGGDYGAVEGGLQRKGSGSGVFIRRNSVTATSHSSFERPLSSIPSGKSLTSKGSSHGSIRTRTTSISRQVYHEDLKQSLDSGLTVTLVFATFIIVFGSSFLFGWNIGVLNQPVDLIQNFYNETYSDRHGPITKDTLTLLWSLTNALFLPGGMAGAFLGGGLADKFGRKRTILFSQIFSLSGAVLGCVCLKAKAPELLMLARILFGINSGLGNCLAPMFLSEISPYNLRGALGTVHQLAITFGIALSSVFGMTKVLGTADLWPYLMLLEAGPALVSCLALPFLPDPPRFLLLCKNDREAARKSLQFYRRRKDVAVDMEEMDTETRQGEQKGQDEDFTVKRFLASKDLYRPLAVACALQVIQQFSGINAVFFYSKGIFRNANVGETQIEYAVVGTNFVNVFMTVITVLIMDMAGRRMLLLIPMVFMVLDLAVLTMALHLKSSYSWMNFMSVGCIIIYVIGFAVGLGPIPMMIGAELFRQAPRPLAMAAAGVVNWVATFVIAMSFESIQDKLKDYTFLLFMVFMVLFTLFVYFFVPETKNKTFEEIAHQFSPGAVLEVEEMLDEEDEVFADAPNSPSDIADGAERPAVNFNLGESEDQSDTEDVQSNGKESIPMIDKSDQSEEDLR